MLHASFTNYLLQIGNSTRCCEIVHGAVSQNNLLGQPITTALQEAGTPRILELRLFTAGFNVVQCLLLEAAILQDELFE